MKLNKIQEEMGQVHEGPCLVAAVAGSGKTTGIVHNMITKYQSGIRPESVMLTTFSQDAARNMKDKLTAVYGSIMGLAPIGTSHSLMYKVLKAHSKDEISLMVDFTRRMTVKKSIPINKYKMNMEGEILAMIGYMKNALCLPYDVPGTDVHANYKAIIEDICSINDMDDRIVDKCFLAYQNELNTSKTIDFDDMLLSVYIMFKQHPEILSIYQNQWKHLIVDEYQDTNAVQYELFKMIVAKHRNFIAVGDDDQAIYGFRGSVPQYMKDFLVEYPDAKYLTLHENYRSQADITQAANILIAHNRDRIVKTITPTKAGSGAPYHIFCEDEKQEANMIASMVAQSPLRKGNIAVLTRLNAQQCFIEEAFIDADIPYIVMDSTPFYARREIKALLVYLSIINTRMEDMALIREVANVPYRKIEKALVQKWEKLEDMENSPFGLHFRTTLERLMLSYEETNDLPSLIQQIINEPIYLGAWSKNKPQGDDQGAVASLTFVQKQSAGYTINDFIERIHNIQNNYDKNKRDNSRKDKVVVSTIHKSKGLEWEEVYIPGFQSGKMPHKSNMDVEEERRLAYVGITRAKTQLVLTSKVTECVSPFLDEIRELVRIETMVPDHYIPPEYRENN